MGFKRIRVMVDLLSEEESKKEAILNGNKFTRNRKIDLQEMILIILNNKGKTFLKAIAKDTVAKSAATIRNIQKALPDSAFAPDWWSSPSNRCRFRSWRGYLYQS